MTRTKRLKKKQETTPIDPQPTDELQKTDALDDFLFHATNYIYKRRKAFSAFGIAFIVLLLGGYGIHRFIEYRNDLRTEELFEIETVLHNNRLTDQQRYEKATPLIDDFLANHQGGKQSKIVLFYRSSLHFQQKKYQEAEKDLRSVIDLLEKPSEFHTLASIYLSNILRDQGKKELAIKVLQAAKSEIMAEILLMELAEAYFGAGKTAEARSILQSIMQDYPQSIYRNRIEQLLTML